MSKFKSGHDPRRNTAGRPRGRIAAFRNVLGELTGDGREIAERLLAVIRNPETSNKEIIEASALVLSYLLGKPEQAVSVEGDVAVTAHAQLDMRAVLARLPTELVDRVVGAIDAAQPHALADGGETDDDDGR